MSDPASGRASSPERAAPWRAALALALVNALLAALVLAPQLGYVPAGSPPRAWAFAGAALVSTALSVALALWLLLLPVAAAWRRLPRAVPLALGLAWATLALALYADTRLYALFRYHANGMVWNVLTTPGAEDAVELGASDVALLAAGLAVLVAGETWAARRLARAPRGAWRRVRWPAVALAALAIVGEKLGYAWADLRNDRQVLTLARLFPLYQRLTVRRLATRTLGLTIEPRAEFDLASPGLLVDYPRARPSFAPLAPDARRPNVLMIVVDSLRRDVLTPELMPHLDAFAAERGRRFEDHLSGGNATRFGIFALIYGLHGTYWHALLADRRPPVLVTELQELGYEPRVLAAASMSFPEFRSTAWVTIPEAVEDAFAGEKWSRDMAVAARFAEWLGARGGARERPFFAFLLLDSPHQGYSVPPPDCALGGPLYAEYADKPAYDALSRGGDAQGVELLRRRYWNAVHHADAVVGEILGALEAQGELERTLMVVTGDHGEEFFENGLFGHTSTYAPVQTAVALVLAGPGVPVGVEHGPTSHVDVAPTLLELLGADAARRAKWCQGESLLEPRSGRRRVLAGWDDAALVTPGGILRLPLESHAGFLEAFDAAWRPLDDPDALIAAEAGELADFARAAREFLR
jgi:membrane-anchored protein YejM (alkaline phosphatase superfamily)